MKDQKNPQEKMKKMIKQSHTKKKTCANKKL